MAEPNLPPLQSPYIMSNMSASHPSNPEPAAQSLPMPPVFGGYSSYSYESSGYHQFHPNPYGPQASDPNNSPFHYHQNRLSPYPQFSDPAAYRPPSLFPSTGEPFTSGGNATPASGPYRNSHMPGSPHPDFAESRNRLELLPAMEHSMPGSGQPYPLPSYAHILPPQLHGFNPYSGRRPVPLIPPPAAPQSSRFGAENGPSASQGRMSSRGVNGGDYDTSRTPSSPMRRSSYERQHQQSPLGPGGPDRRSLPFLNAHSRRSDRSISPRTSHRRSFDRYSTDLSPSSTAEAEAEQAAARARIVQRRRMRERAYAARQPHTDPNIPSPSQMQALKDKLRHFLPSELPEGSSACCDICQKDYSTKHCLPTEDDEVAIQLPCKHVFGEHCINTWFETCKTHKNKITCPMCRTLLIEPRPTSGPFLHAMPEMMALFSRGNLSLSDRQLLENMVRTRERELEGDF